MEFGEVLRKYRNSYNFSINKMAHMANISAPYVRKLEKKIDLKPSKQILYKIIYAFRNEEDKDAPFDAIREFINAFIDASPEENKERSTESEIFTKLFYEYLDKQRELQETEQVPYLIGKEDIYNNFISVNSDLKIDNLLADEEHAFYDISTLLSQKKYKLMYGRDLKINNTEGLLYNVLNDEDKEIIKKLIDAYLKTRYEKIKNPREYFENIFNDLYEKDELRNEFKDNWW